MSSICNELFYFYYIEQSTANQQEEISLTCIFKKKLDTNIKLTYNRTFINQSKTEAMSKYRRIKRKRRKNDCFTFLRSTGT